jgi:hypothetical protein
MKYGITPYVVDRWPKLARAEEMATPTKELDLRTRLARHVVRVYRTVLERASQVDGYWLSHAFVRTGGGGLGAGRMVALA